MITNLHRLISKIGLRIMTVITQSKWVIVIVQSIEYVSGSINFRPLCDSTAIRWQVKLIFCWWGEYVKQLFADSSPSSSFQFGRLPCNNPNAMTV